MPSREAFEQARLVLSGFVEQQAESIGKPWVVVEEDPCYDLLSRGRQWHSPEPFKVWGGASDKTVYTSPKVNHAFRLWHDWLHISYGFQTTLGDELLLGAIHTDAALVAGKNVAKLMWIDTCGQSLYYSEHGHFPVDQLEFAWAKFQAM